MHLLATILQRKRNDVWVIYFICLQSYQNIGPYTLALLITINTITGIQLLACDKIFWTHSKVIIPTNTKHSPQNTYMQITIATAYSGCLHVSVNKISGSMYSLQPVTLFSYLTPHSFSPEEQSFTLLRPRKWGEQVISPASFHGTPN